MTENFENVNHLVLNFYPDGYSIAVKLNEFPVFTSETILETAKISYEETSLLDYIENEELPPLLVEMIDGSPKLSQYKIWHNGCLILEVRDKLNLNRDEDNDDERAIDNNNKNNNDHRYCTNIRNTAKEFSYQQYDATSNRLNAQWMLNNTLKDYQGVDDGDELGSLGSNTKTTNGSYFILLKPTNLSMLNDVLNLTESNSWSTEDRLQLESQIVLYNSPPLFLEPDATQQPPPDQSSLWPDNRINNFYTRHKKKLPHNKLKGLQSSKTVGYSKLSSNHHQNHRNSFYQNTTDILPPELTLQQFLATKRARKKTYAAGHLARFHRFKKHMTGSMK